MAQVGTLDFKAFVEGRTELSAAMGEGGATAYAYAYDMKTRAAIAKAKPVEHAVTAAVRLLRSTGKAPLLGHSIKVGPNQFPRMHRLAQQCADTLGISTPTLYIVNNPYMNASTYGTNDDSFIMVHSALVDQFSDDELLYVLGHECGHIHNSHVVYLTAMYLLTQMASSFAKWLVEPALLALSSWSRSAEITCDRAGLLCAKNLDVATRSFTRLALGSIKLHDELNVEAFVSQYEEAQASVGRYAELRESHPWLPKRVLALRAFAESELYRRHAGIGGGGIAMQEVDTKVHEIIKIWD
ncbi:M48 family metallopeptidase [Chondromyces crocatus]|uniref:Peptidase M48 n=1 Tax=Chondromyces crocatus TaxID=52 RepID=A0A0K1E908_CHOCO|nr:M48 family metallopeptidase [Chondromyces crocatus]AKT37366.1 peptidase M48 [Chondromyces crocatus]